MMPMALADAITVPGAQAASMRPRLRHVRNLVVLRAGDDSLHQGWIADPRRDFDLFISYYGAAPQQHARDADYYEMRRGPKWPCIGALLAEHAPRIDAYDCVWFPDDDLAADTPTLNRMFAFFHAHALDLAQPALTPDSYYTWHTLLAGPALPSALHAIRRGDGTDVQPRRACRVR